MKKCGRCKLEKELNEFSKNIRMRDGLNNSCRPCSVKFSQAWAAKNPDRKKENRRRYSELNKEHELAYSRAYRIKNLEKVKESERSYRARNADKVRAWSLAGQLRRMVKLYGITNDQYLEMLRAQDGVCFICHRINSSGKRLSIDHNHITKRIRKLLCQNCNILIGHCRENPEILESARQYLISHI